MPPTLTCITYGSAASDPAVGAAAFCAAWMMARAAALEKAGMDVVFEK